MPLAASGDWRTLLDQKRPCNSGPDWADRDTLCPRLVACLREARVRTAPKGVTCLGSFIARSGSGPQTQADVHPAESDKHCVHALPIDGEEPRVLRRANWRARILSPSASRAISGRLAGRVPLPATPPPRCRAGDELTAAAHSITSSARASSIGGTSRSSALAVLRLITSSNFVGCWTGRSPGFSPLRMRST